jgi:hypothetical protein
MVKTRLHGPSGMLRTAAISTASPHRRTGGQLRGGSVAIPNGGRQVDLLLRCRTRDSGPSPATAASSRRRRVRPESRPRTCASQSRIHAGNCAVSVDLANRVLRRPRFLHDVRADSRESPDSPSTRAAKRSNRGVQRRAKPSSASTDPAWPSETRYSSRTRPGVSSTSSHARTSQTRVARNRPPVHSGHIRDIPSRVAARAAFQSSLTRLRPWPICFPTGEPAVTK